MNEHQKETARACLAAAESDALPFARIIETLGTSGFEGYAVDFRRGLASYCLPDGDSIDLTIHPLGAPVAATFDAARLRDAIREAQQQVPGYTYRGFCAKAAAAGCAFYVVSFPGRRALYVGRTAETHVELFPS